MSSTRTDSPVNNNYNEDTVTRPLALPASPALKPVRPITETNIANNYAAQKHRVVDSLRFFTDAAKALPDSAKSFHIVEKVLKKGSIWFFKHNVCGSKMSELEAVAWSYYHIVAPEYVPAKANAIYDRNGEYVGVSVQEIPNFQSTMDDPLTEADLLNKTIVKGLAIGLTLSYFFEEDDLHRGNMSKYGFRIDFDMSVWPVLGQFKDGSALDWMYRPCLEERFRITRKDIHNFPNITDAKPFYWPTKPQPIINEETRKVLSRFVPISKNAFPTVENGLFKKLKEDPVFKYYKYKTLLKCLLISNRNFEVLTKQHIRADLRHSDPRLHHIKIADMLVDHLDARKKQLRKVLVNMPGFQKFIWRHGETVKKEILQEFTAYNQQIKDSECKKWNKHPERSTAAMFHNRIHIEEVKNTYSEIFREAKQAALNSKTTPPKPVMHTRNTP
jgi:hypothetical protein